jgi:FHA domain
MLDCETRQAAPFAEVFVRTFPRMAELHSSFTRDGLLAVAVWNARVVAEYLHIPAGEGPEFAVIGRHDRCDLSLGHDPALSLRHSLLGVRTSGGEMRVRLLDLQSGSGFFTEEGQRCEALSADGPVFVRTGGYHLFLLPTGGLWPIAWAATAEDTWKTIPERVYRDCRVPARGAPAPLHRGPGRAGSSSRSVITQMVHPPGMLRSFRPPVGERGPPAAEIELDSLTGHESFAVHEAELERGLLVGRYERCQLGSRDDKMSRVHLLIIRDGDEVWAIDTASTNGTTANGQPVRRVKMDGGAALLLAEAIALRWYPASP